MAILKNIVRFMLISLALTTSAVFADDAAITNDRLVFQPASVFNGHLYAVLNAAYNMMFFKVNSPDSSITYNGASKQMQNGAAAIELGYQFDRNYTGPIRLGLDLIYRPEKTFTMAPVVAGSANYARGQLQTTEMLANLYYDFHNDSEFVPYVGAGLGVAHHSTKFEVKNMSTDALVNSSVNGTANRLAWDVMTGLTMNMSERFDIDAFMRLNSLGKVGFISTPVTTGIAYAAESRTLYSADIGLGLRYTFA